MNIAEMYAKSAGRKPDKVNDNAEFIAEFTQEQKLEWINHPITRMFILFLKQDYDENIALAMNNVETGSAKYLIRAKKIKEIIDHASNINTTE